MTHYRDADNPRPEMPRFCEPGPPRWWVVVAALVALVGLAMLLIWAVV